MDIFLVRLTDKVNTISHAFGSWNQAMLTSNSEGRVF